MVRVAGTSTTRQVEIDSGRRDSALLIVCRPIVITIATFRAMSNARRSPETARLRFARLLKTERLSRGISQEGLAELAGLHRTYVGSVERGERNIAVDNMEALAGALELDISDLLRPELTTS